MILLAVEQRPWAVCSTALLDITHGRWLAPCPAPEVPPWRWCRRAALARAYVVVPVAWGRDWPRSCLRGATCPRCTGPVDRTLILREAEREPPISNCNGTPRRPVLHPMVGPGGRDRVQRSHGLRPRSFFPCS